MTLDLARALRTALEYETRVRDLYRQAAARSRDPVGQRVLGLLADEEQQHLDTLQGLLVEWTRSGRLTPARLHSAVPDPQTLRDGLATLRSRAPTDKPASSEHELLKQALQAESETSEFYRRMVHELDGEGQALFEEFVQIEEAHLALVQSEIDHLTGLGFWFDIREFDLESG